MLIRTRPSELKAPALHPALGAVACRIALHSLASGIVTDTPPPVLWLRVAMNEPCTQGDRASLADCAPKLCNALPAAMRAHQGCAGIPTPTPNCF